MSDSVRRRVMAFPALPMTVLFLAAACGAGRQAVPDGGGAGDGGSLMTLRDFCRQSRAILVAQRKKCLAETEAEGEAFYNVDFCAAWDAALKDGRITYDGSRAAACIATLRDLPCTGGVLDPCVGVVNGTLAPGSTCELARSVFIFSECAGDAECVGGAAVSCTGTCVSRARGGEPCNGLSQPCTLGTQCDARTSRCAPAPTAGEPCGISSILVCASGLFCSDLFSGGICMPQHATGPCQHAGECTPPAVCPTGGGLCWVPPDVGDPCGSGCGERLLCGPDLRCTRFSVPGESCTGSAPGCAFGFCGSTGTCDVRRPGEACASGANAECGTNALCIYTPADGQRHCTARCL